jgi:hypothetical protein
MRTDSYEEPLMQATYGTAAYEKAGETPMTHAIFRSQL